METKHFKVVGKVQGVCFRKYTKLEAEKLGVCGWIRNDESGAFVEGECNGTAQQLALFEQFLHKGPRHAKVGAVEMSAGQGIFSTFEIRK